MSAEMTVFVKSARTRFHLEKYPCPYDVLMIASSGRYRVRDAGAFCEMEPLQGYRFAAGRDYERYVEEPVTIYCFRFRDEEGILPSGPVRFRDTDRVASTLRLLDAVEGCDPATAFRHQRALFRDLVNQYAIENGSAVAVGGDPLMEEAARYLRENAHLSLPLPEVAAHCGLSYVQFSRRFKAATGLTPSSYLTGLRMRKARQLLESGDLTLAAIAPACGFNSEYYFSNCFKKYHHMSPTEYRREVRL